MLNLATYCNVMVGATGFEPATPSPPERFCSIKSCIKSSGLRSTASFKRLRISASLRAFRDNSRHKCATMHPLAISNSVAGVCANINRGGG